MKMRFVMPVVKGRGAGLGNELNVWSKALIAAQELGCHALQPAWGLNARGYRRYFATSRFDWVVYWALRQALPTYTFDAAVWKSQGGGDLSRAVRGFAEAERLLEKPVWILEMEGLWGGRQMFSQARIPLLAELLGTRHTAENLFAVDREIPPDRLRVAMHIRRGDFGAPLHAESYRGRFNTALPIDWYVNIARGLLDAFGDRVHLLLLTDASEEELAPILKQSSNVTTTSSQRFTDVSDMLAMAFSDFIVCSISSFSLWAVTFSQARYAWYAPQLSPVDGFAAIWAHETAQQESGSPTRLAAAEAAGIAASAGTLRQRGFAIGADGQLSDALLEELERTIEVKRRSTDLIRYGVVPASANSR